MALYGLSNIIFLGCDKQSIKFWSIADAALLAKEETIVTEYTLYSIKILDTNLFVSDSSGCLKIFEIISDFGIF